MEEGQLYSAAYGYFNPGEGMEYLWYKDGGEFTEDDEPVAYVENGSGGSGNQNAHPDSYWSWDSDLCQRNVSEFEGVWYYDGDLSAEMYVVIDGNGDWSYYQRAPGAEAAEMIMAYSLIPRMKQVPIMRILPYMMAYPTRYSTLTAICSYGR